MSAEAIAPGRRAVVTGAASRIKLAAERAFAAKSMRITLCDRAVDALNALLQALKT